MISSEVQRTLVKSPPELWAELSDPAALARHLGELGEIRITRVEPEQLVEFAAGNRTGTVHIKPSGWGTKVTLTVAAEVPAASTSAPAAPPQLEGPASSTPDRSPPADALAPPEAHAPDPSPPSTEAAAFAAAEPPAFPQDEPAAFAEEEPASAAEEEPASAAEEEPASAADSVPSRLGVPLTAAAASSWRANTKPLEPEDQDAGWIAEDADELPPQAVDREDDGDTYEWLPYDEPEPRRGFFARFFGRWRKPEDAEAGGAEESPEAASPAGALPEPEQPANESLPESAAPAITEPLVPDADTALDADTGLDADTALEADSALDADTEAAPPEAPAADEVENDQAPAEPVANAAAAGPEAASQQQVPAEQGEDIAAELKAAEETEDAEVTAVLTSVLDRLGAAHHRPFSRS
jgi:hypothetical protein